MEHKDRLFIERKALFRQQLIGDSKDVYSGTYARDPSRPTQVLPVALKILSRKVSTDVERIVDMLHTASLHCHYVSRFYGVCRFYGVSQIDADACLVTKLYKQSLQAELDATSGQSLPLKVAMRRCLDIGRGLQELHSIGIIMRDLKPSDVLLGYDGTAILSGFGLAKAIFVAEASQSTLQDWPTTPYMAPEMVKDDPPPITTKADVWGLGCILLQLSSGGLWSDDMSPHEIAGEIHNEQAPVIPNTLPQALQDMLTGCFKARPEERLTMEAVLQGLEGLQDGTSLSYSPDVHVRSVANEEEGPKANKAATKQSSAGRGILRGDSAQQENATKSSETAVADADMQAWQSKLSFMRQQVKDLPWIAEMVELVRTATTSPSGLCGNGRTKQRMCFAMMWDYWDELQVLHKEVLDQLVNVDMIKLMISLFEEASEVDQAVANIFARVCWRCYATYTYAFAFKRNKVAKDGILWQRLIDVMNHYVTEVLWLGAESRSSDDPGLLEATMQICGLVMLAVRGLFFCPYRMAYSDALKCMTKSMMQTSLSFMKEEGHTHSDASQCREAFVLAGGLEPLVKCYASCNSRVRCWALRVSFDCLDPRPNKDRREGVMRAKEVATMLRGMDGAWSGLQKIIADDEQSENQVVADLLIGHMRLTIVK